MMALTQSWCNDAILVVSLLYLSVDIQYDWDTFATCHRPIHKWLLVSYTLILAARVICIVGSLQSTAESGKFLLNIRHNHAVGKFLTSFTWLIIVPCFTFWSIIGTTWFLEVKRHTPDCLPSDVHLWFLAIWQVLGYLWVLIHTGLGTMAWFLERRLRSTELDLAQIEDTDVVTRWGQVSRLQGYTAVQGLSKEGGLTPAQILALPSVTVPEHPQMVEEECPICLNGLKCGDNVRQLGPCGHTFHRSCIDLWLLRRADCPLCKRTVKGYDPVQGWQ